MMSPLCLYLMQLLIKKNAQVAIAVFKDFRVFYLNFLFFLNQEIKKKEILSENIHIKFMDPNKEQLPLKFIVLTRQLKFSYIF